MSNAKIGSVQDPWSCCDTTFVIYDENDNAILKVHGSCCQCGKFCSCPCGPCKSIKYHITAVKDNQDVGLLERTFRLANLTSLTDADNYVVHFEKIADPKWKALVMATAIFLDMRYFEESPADD